MDPELKIQKYRKQKHISVLLNELTDGIKKYKNKQNIIVDATLGMAGHAIKIIQDMNPGDILIGFDADRVNIREAKERIGESLSHYKIKYIFIDSIQNLHNDRVNIILFHSNFLYLKEKLEDFGIQNITGIYYDFGLSSLHIDEAERGFSFSHDGPLDMRFDKTSGRKASDIVNSYNEAELRKLFLKYGEESGSAKIASRIVTARKKKKFETTGELASIIPSLPKVKARIFQALRIEVNNELENIKKSLHDALEILGPEGRICVISFHSLEDRIVKQFFKKETRDCICHDLICTCKHTKSLKILTKKPIIPNDAEIKINPRSRSAKLRCAEKLQ